MSVPTAAAGPNVPAAQAREDSKDAVEAIRIISEAAIKSAGADVEVVKFIFTAMAGLAALLGFLGFKTYAESRELVQKIAKDASENLSTLGSSISEMMTIQNSIEANYPRLTSLVDEIRATQPSDQGLSEKSSNLESIAKQIIDDLNRNAGARQSIESGGAKPGTTLGGLDRWLARVNAALGWTRRKSDSLPEARDPAIERRGRVGEES